MPSAPSLLDWQVNSACDLQDSLLKHGVAADGSDTGTGKTYKVCADSAMRGHPLVVLCPKSMVADWANVAGLFGVPAQVVNYEKVRTGKTPLGKWQVKGKVFEWTIRKPTVLVFDEAHRCGGLKTQNSVLLIAAKRQRIPTALLSATLIASPLKCYAIGFALGLHNLVNFWKWARSMGVVDGFFGPEWAPHKLPVPRTEEQIMQEIRLALGDKFTRIRKADVPGFPELQNIPQFVQTEEMPDLDSNYSMEARRTVELLKVPGIVERAGELIGEGMSVAIFVNFRATLKALQEAFPKAVSVFGGQSTSERGAAINSFQQNEVHVILLMAQAGGTGVSLHDLRGRPRAALISPGYDAVEFKQVLGRIHRAGSLSAAINFLLFASGVPVERRIRARLEKKLTNLTALNDYDLADAQPNPAGSPSPVDGAAEDSVALHADQYLAGACQSTIGASDGAPDGGTGASGPAAGIPPRNSANQEELMNRAKIIAPKPADAIDVQATVINSVPPAAPSTAVGHHVERKHARCSPSKLKNLEICPSYESDESQPPHPVTLRGTAMHEALETSNDSKLDPSAETGPAGTEVGLVTMCREFQDAEAAPGEIVILEPHLKTHDRDVQGFADRVVIEPAYEYRVAVENPTPGGPTSVPRLGRKARIRDYKMGWNLVDLPNINPQAIAYTVALFLEYPDVTEVNFAFLIPRLDAVLEHTFYRHELDALKLRISAIAEGVRAHAGKVFNIVESNCLYCGRKALCDAMNAKVLVIRNGVKEDERLPLPASFDLETITEPQQVAYLLNMASMAESWAQQAKALALRFRLELGQEIPGYDLVERKAKREIANPVAAFEVAKEFGITESEYIAASKMSITSLDKSVREHAAAGTKDTVAAQFTDRLTDEGALTRGASYHVLQRTRKKAKPAQLAA